MNNATLIHVIRSLDLSEQGECKKWLASDFLVEHPMVKKLGVFLFGFAPNFRDPALKKETVWNALFSHLGPWNNKSARTLNNWMSDLTEWLLDYMAEKELECQSLLKKELKTVALLRRGAKKLAKRQLQSWKLLLDKQTPEHANHLRALYQFDYYRDQLLGVENSSDSESYFRQLNTQLDLHFWINKLRLACRLLARRIVLDSGFVQDIQKDIQAFIQLSPRLLAENNLLKTYASAWEMMKYMAANEEEAAEKEYLAYSSTLRNELHHFNEVEQRELFNYAMNYCIRQLNAGRTQYYKEILQLYREGLRTKILFDNGILTQWTFKNIVTTAIRIGEFDWTKIFIEEYSKYLIPAEKEKALAYNRAMLFHSQGNYDACLKALQWIEFRSPFYHMGAKILQIQSYFELEESEALYSLIEASRSYLRRTKKLSAFHKKSNLRFLTLVRKIYLLKVEKQLLPQKKFLRTKTNLSNQLNLTEPVVNRDWLLSMLEVV